MPLVRLEPATPGYRVKHSTTEPPSSSNFVRGPLNVSKYHILRLYALVYKFKQIVGKPNFSDQCKKDCKTLYKSYIYNLDVMAPSACLHGL